ncbi:hypothetical protein AB1I62_03940 [Enterococcus sp. AN402]|uniref:hypothetical protein n=1 Tax=Enterococcus sp. AN402 TaxID=3151386 RepID=UPI0034584E02
MGKISRKQYVKLYQESNIEFRECLLKCLKHDIINAFNFIWYKGLFTKDLFSVNIEREKKIVERVIDLEQIELMVDLYFRLSETAHSIQRLEKHFQKLENTL